MLVSTQPPDVVVLWDWLMNPGDRHESESHHRGARELLQVHAGDLPHSYGNAGAEPARFSLTVYEQQTSAARGQENSHHLTTLTR